jgi:hypothetical protein
MRAKLWRFWRWLRFGKITERVTDYAGDHVVAEVEYRGRWGRVVGYWAYGHWDPSLPFRCDEDWR